MREPARKERRERVSTAPSQPDTSESREKFGASGRNFFLTYSRCSLPKEQMLEFLRGLAYGPAAPVFIRVAHEKHKDGADHLHCLIQFKQKFDCRRMDFFDHPHPNRGEPYHGRIEVAKNATAVRRYISKERDFADWGTYVSGGRSNGRAECYAAALASDSQEEAMEVIKEGDPKSFVIYHDRLNSNLGRIFKPPQEIYVSQFSAFTVPVDLLEWARDNVRPPDSRPARPMSCIIEGPSRIGKTCWARSLGPHNYLCGHLDLNQRTYNNDAWYNVIDDVTPQYLKHWKEFIGAQKNWQSNCKYSKPVQIKGGIPAIVLCNPGEESSYKEHLEKPSNEGLKRWTIANAEFFFLDETPLFRTTPASSQEAPASETH